METNPTGLSVPGTGLPVTRKKDPFLITSILVLLLVVSYFGTAIYLVPGFSLVPWSSQTVLVIGDQKIGERIIRVEEREIYIHVATLQSYLDPHFFWDEQEKTAIITTADRVIHMYSEALTAEVNLQPVELRFPLREDEEGLFLPLLFLADFYAIQVDHHPATDTVVIDRLGEAAYLAVIDRRTIRLRENPGLRQPFLAVLQQGEQILLYEEQDGWCLVRTAGGLTGYIPRKSFIITGPYPLPGRPPVSAAAREKRLPQAPLVMAWEATWFKQAINTIGEMPSLQIVSPTWFTLKDSQGNLINRADPAYIHWARERGYHVWALVSSDFYNPANTAEALSSSATRRKVIDQLLIYARLYELDGINLDFENFHYTYRDHYTQFVRELAPLCHAEGLVLSVDVTMISMEPYWSRCYDRGALAEAADFIMLMAYDEHWTASPVAGSVASLPWVERGLQKVLLEVPPDKLILGVPFYTRLWQVEQLEGGGEKATYRASPGMERAEQILTGKEAALYWDSKSGQNIAEYIEDGLTYKMWMEDAFSMAQRLELVNRYNLAGVAAWHRGLEKAEIWDLIGTILLPAND